MSDSAEHDFPRHFWKEWIKKQLVACFSAALVGGQPQRDYVWRLGISADRIFTGYDAVDNDYFASRADEVRQKKNKTRQQLGLQKPFILTIARFIAEKNLSGAMQAYAQYVQCRGSSAWNWVICGDGPLKDELVDLRQKLSLNSHVNFPGFVQYENLPLYYGLAQVFWLPSVKDTWGLVVNEAMACGLPVLVSRSCGCCEDLVHEEENGFSFDPRDIDGMGAKLLKISDGDCDLVHMGRKSRSIISHWGCDTFAQNLWKAAEVAYRTAVLRNNLTASAILKGLTFGR